MNLLLSISSGCAVATVVALSRHLWTRRHLADHLSGLRMQVVEPTDHPYALGDFVRSLIRLDASCPNGFSDALREFGDKVDPVAIENWLTQFVEQVGDPDAAGVRPPEDRGRP